jgi:hypothetical protein
LACALLRRRELSLAIAKKIVEFSIENELYSASISTSTPTLTPSKIKLCEKFNNLSTSLSHDDINSILYYMSNKKNLSCDEAH